MARKTSPKPKRASTSRVTTKKVQETDEHAKLKVVLKEIVRACGFKFDTEVALNFTGNRDENRNPVDERSMDVVAYGTGKGKSFLIVFECKGGSDIKGIQSKISAWEADILKIKNGKTKVISSEANEIREGDLSQVDDVQICYVFGKSIEQERFNQIASLLNQRGFHAWDNNAMTYYKKTAETIGKAAKYQILKEFNVNLESSEICSGEAIRIKQGRLEMFVFGAKPSVLLKVGYVYRRASGKPSAYQRIVNRDRIKKISEFLSSPNALLPNAIIIAFDADPDIQKDISYNDGKLYFPKKYCSAWIIDGQHRVYGFLNTRFERIDEDDSEQDFKLPVVAFKNLDSLFQNRTFVSINYNQKKIDPTLLCDLAMDLPDLQNELTWPSRLVRELNRIDPLKNRVKISELDAGKPITVSSFARYGLLEGLLGFDKKNRSYNGVLNTYAPIRPKALLTNSDNQASFKKQTELLRRYFDAVEQNTRWSDEKKDPWRNTKKCSLLKATGINALLLVLSRIMEKYPRLEADIQESLPKYLRPLRKVNFAKEFVAKQGGGWKGFRKLANVILRKLNAAHGGSLRLFGKKEKK